MELIRGKTFIINYAQNPPERLPQVGGKEKKKAQCHTMNRECETKKNVTGTQRMSNGACTKVAANNVRYPKPVKKSKTYDCVTRDDKPEKSSGVSTSAGLPTSISSPGLIEDPGGKRNDLQTTRPSTCKQSIIDYRHFVPQMPFVPSVAKSLPRKRISLRRSKKSLKDMFNLRRNKQQETISEDERLQTPNDETARCRMIEIKSPSHYSDIFPDEFVASEFPDREICIDAIDSLKTLCEDVASLKSFDSLTGCGEIFADECSSFIDVENCRVTFIAKPSPIAANFQGGGERLASPAKSECIDFSKLRGHVKSLPSNLQNANGAESLPDVNEIVKIETNDNVPRDQLSTSSYNDLSSGVNINNPESPKSTSDEGYYESYSPGLEEKNENVPHRSLPRDRYSGDALYELFCEEPKIWPDQKCEFSESVENPTSIYSFCVGSEENMVPQPPFVQTDDAAQNTWNGRECLLKLCDTELTLSMGMVNWLKKKGQITDSDETFMKHETICQSNTVNNNTALETALPKDSVECYTIQGDHKEKEYCNIIRRIRDSEEMLADILSGDTAQEPITSSLKSHESLLGKTYPSEKLMPGEEDSKTALRNITSHMKNQNESTSSNSLFSLEATREQNGKNVPNLNDHVDTVSSLGLQYLTSSISDDNNNLVEILDKFPARLSTFHITFGSKNTMHCGNPIMRPYEIAQNIKNLIDHQDSGSQPLLPRHALLPSHHDETDKQHLKTNDESVLLNTLSKKCLKEECGSEDQVPKATSSQKTVSKANILPFFKSPCSSVISRVSSALYKVHKSGDAVIFFNAGKYRHSSSNDDFTHDSSTLSVEFPNITKDGFASVSLAPNLGDRVGQNLHWTADSRCRNGVFVGRNSKWSM